MSDHYQLIRTSPEYRNFLMLEEMRAEMQPPLSLPLSREDEPIEQHIIYHHIHSNLSDKQAHSIENNTNQILALKKIFNDHLEKYKRKYKYSNKKE